MSPFLGDNDMETIQNISAGEYDFPDPCPEDGYEDISALAKQFIDSLLLPQPKLGSHPITLSLLCLYK